MVRVPGKILKKKSGDINVMIYIMKSIVEIQVVELQTADISAASFEKLHSYNSDIACMI